MFTIHPYNLPTVIVMFAGIAYIGKILYTKSKGSKKSRIVRLTIWMLAGCISIAAILVVAHHAGK